MARSPSQAIAFAMKITSGYGGMCLQFTRTCFGIGPKWASAQEAWNRNTHKHPTSSLKNIPIGAPVFFKSPNHNFGHVAIYLGGGKIRSSNSRANNRVFTVAVSSYTNAGYTFLGWAEEINGVEIPGLNPPSTWNKKKSQAVQRAIRVDDDGYFDDISYRGLRAVRYASRFGGKKFPWGVAFTQRRVGTKPDSDWKVKSIAAHDATVRALCVAFGTTPRTVWDSTVEKAYKAFIAANYKTW